MGPVPQLGGQLGEEVLASGDQRDAAAARVDQASGGHADA
jgi:hypothetical protein